jgi:hypothetical protein
MLRRSVSPVASPTKLPSGSARPRNAFRLPRVTGGRLLEQVMAERARQLGDAFTMERFFDELNAVGLIPVSLIHWELTGSDALVRPLLTTPERAP